MQAEPQVQIRKVSQTFVEPTHSNKILTTKNHTTRLADDVIGSRNRRPNGFSRTPKSRCQPPHAKGQRPAPRGHKALGPAAQDNTGLSTLKSTEVRRYSPGLQHVVAGKHKHQFAARKTNQTIPIGSHPKRLVKRMHHRTGTRMVAHQLFNNLPASVG